MPFSISAELRYSVYQRSTVLLSLHAHSSSNQILRDECFTITEGSTCEFFPLEVGDNRYVRLDTGDLTNLLVTYAVMAETRVDSRQVHEISEIPVSKIKRQALPYLFPSRYCQSDRLFHLANKLFGRIDHPLAKAAAISDWIYENVDYLPGATNASTSAHDTLTERVGVCRDFAHLGIAFCRALSIPARYFSGYACNMQPPDFHACFEVCVGNEWYIFDPTRLAAPNGLVRIATGHDAADTSTAMIFGSMYLESIMVSCTAEDFVPLRREDLVGKAVLLEP